MTVLIDINVILDYLQNREPFRKSAIAVLDMCAKKHCVGYVAGYTIPTIFYILRKEFSVKDRRDLLLGMCKTLDVAGLNKAMIVAALNNEDFSDFEDCLQTECALSIGASYIITRNIADFTTSSVPAVTPEAFLQNEAGNIP